MKLKVAVILLTLSLIYYQGFSQSFYTYGGRDAIASVGVGTSTYYGDLQDPGDYMDAKPSLAIGLQRFYTNRIAARLEATYFRLSGDDSDAEAQGRVVRNLSFRSDNIEVNLVGILNAFPKGRRFYQRPPLNPYGFAGIGVIYYNPKAKIPDEDWNGNRLLNAGKYTELQPLQTEGVSYQRFAIVVPFGFGVKYKISPFTNIALEGGYRLTFTDYLDDVSTTYQLHNSIEDPLTQALADRRHEIDLAPLGLEEDHIRGNPDENDGYFLLSIKLEYYLPTQILNFNKKNNRKRYKKKFNKAKSRLPIP